MNKKISVFNDNGEAMEAEVLLSFRLPKLGKEYVLYTFGEKDTQNMETIHASIITKTDNEYKLETVPEYEWEVVKDVMREIIRNKGEQI